MNQDIVYPYVQETLKPSKNFEDLMAEWKKIGLPRKCFLELYNSVWSYKKGDEMQTMLFDGKLKNIALTLEEYHHMLSELIKKLRLYSPIRFMMLYEAHYYPKSNLTGIENTIKEAQDGWIVDAWINYTHQTTWLQYPAITAKQKNIASGAWDTWAFKTMQDALQFNPIYE